MTVKEFGQSIAQSLGEYPKDLDVIAQFSEWVLEGIEEIVNFFEWSFLTSETTFAVTAGNRLFTDVGDAPGSIVAIAEQDTGRILRYVTYEWILTSGLDPNKPGNPFLWYYHGSGTHGTRVGFYPVPSENKTYIVSKRDALESISSSTNLSLLLPPAFLPTLRAYVKMLYYSGEEEYNAQYDRWAARYGQLLEQAKARLMSTNTPRVPARWTDLSGARIEPNFVVPENIPIP